MKQNNFFQPGPQARGGAVVVVAVVDDVVVDVAVVAVDVDDDTDDDDDDEARVAVEVVASIAALDDDESGAADVDVDNDVVRVTYDSRCFKHFSCIDIVLEFALTFGELCERLGDCGACFDNKQSI